jgi:rod shape determining protein RodA
MTGHRSIRDFDWTLLLLTLTICCLGILQLYSATSDTPFRGVWWKQSVWVVLGTGILLIAALIDYHHLLDRVYWLYGASLAGLVAVFFVGREISGGQRWIPIMGGFHIQVSEIVKLVIILLVARYLVELRSEKPDAGSLLKLSGLVLLPMVLIMKQPDLGTALTFVPILGMGVFLAGMPARQWVVLGLAAVLLLPIGWSLLRDYQKARLVTFVNPDRDPQGAGYQVIQSKIAVGSGGLWGQGIAGGSQTQLRFLPVPHTDFIFSAYGEEHGFVGVVVALGLYFLLLMQIVQNAQRAPDRAGMYICMGVATLLLFQLLVNVGMVVGRMPTTGLPLPLMSYGGSGTLVVFAMLGLVVNVRLQRFVN